MTPYRVEIQTPYKKTLPIARKTIKNWIILVLQGNATMAAEINIRFVNINEITQLNNQYKNKNFPTNILAFPSALPAYIKQKRVFLGDLVVAPEVLFQEHLNLKIPLEAHWAHIIIHGVLHLLGYTHEAEEDTMRMQTLEQEYLAKLNFKNPYFMESQHFEQK